MPPSSKCPVNLLHYPLPQTNPGRDPCTCRFLSKFTQITRLRRNIRTIPTTASWKPFEVLIPRVPRRRRCRCPRGGRGTCLLWNYQRGGWDTCPHPAQCLPATVNLDRQICCLVIMANNTSFSPDKGPTWTLSMNQFSLRALMQVHLSAEMGRATSSLYQAVRLTVIISEPVSSAWTELWERDQVAVPWVGFTTSTASRAASVD